MVSQSLARGVRTGVGPVTTTGRGSRPAPHRRASPWRPRPKGEGKQDTEKERVTDGKAERTRIKKRHLIHLTYTGLWSLSITATDIKSKVFISCGDICMICFPGQALLHPLHQQYSHYMLLTSSSFAVECVTTRHPAGRGQSVRGRAHCGSQHSRDCDLLTVNLT